LANDPRDDVTDNADIAGGRVVEAHRGGERRRSASGQEGGGPLRDVTECSSRDEIECARPERQDGLGTTDDGESASDHYRASLLRRHIRLLLRERGQRQCTRRQGSRATALGQFAAGRHDEGEEMVLRARYFFFVNVATRYPYVALEKYRDVESKVHVTEEREVGSARGYNVCLIKLSASGAFRGRILSLSEIHVVFSAK